VILSFENNNVVVTGAGKGIGAETAKLFCAAGAQRVLLVDIDERALESTRQELSTFASEVRTVCLDISNGEAVRNGFRRVFSDWERAHVLVNSAGIATENGPEQGELFQRVLSVNLYGTHNVCTALLPFIPDHGRIVNVSSILGRAGKAHNTGYATSKHAILGLSKSLALDLAPRKITVNAVLPGWVDTPMLRQELSAQAGLMGVDVSNVLRNARRSIPLRRFVEASEVASLIAFLASPFAAAITAQSFTIDGGYTCGM